MAAAPITAGAAIVGAGGAGAQEPADTSPGPAPRVGIRASRRAGIAPFGVIFEAVTAEEDDLLHAEFVWDFGEHYDFSPIPGDRRPARGAGAARGPAASHVFVTPGEHTVRLIMLRSDVAAAAEITVRVRDPDLHFDDAHTVAVSGVGDFDDAPPAAHRLRNVEDAVRVARSMTTPRGGRGGPRGRVVLRAGETFALAAPIAVGSLQLDRYGEGADPVIRADMERFVADAKDGPGRALLEIAHENETAHTTVANIALEGDYRPNDPAPAPDPAVHVHGIARSFARTPEHTTLFRLRIEGLSHNTLPGENAVIADCLIRDWHFYGLFGHGERHAVIGCRFIQHPLATRGPGERLVNEPPFRNHAEQGPVRFANSDLAVYSRNVMRSTSGWSRFYDAYAVQPAIRHQPESGGRGFFGENHLVGGWGVVSHEAGAVHRGRRPGWILEAQNFVEGDGETEIFVRSPYGRHVVRNSIFTASAPEPLTPATHFHALVLAPAAEASAPGPFEAYANTFFASHPHRTAFKLLHRASGAPEAILDGNLVVAGGFDEVRLTRGSVRLALAERPLDEAYRPREPDAVPRIRLAGRRAIIDFAGRRRPAMPRYGALET